MCFLESLLKVQILDLIFIVHQIFEMFGPNFLGLIHYFRGLTLIIFILIKLFHKMFEHMVLCLQLTLLKALVIILLIVLEIIIILGNRAFTFDPLVVIIDETGLFAD